MAHQNVALVRDCSTLVNFKEWAKAISDFFTTCGWTQTADTGQVNWASIASVPTTGTYVYEIWTPGDGLTAFYVKIEYGMLTTTATSAPIMRIGIGTSTNGTGTLAGFNTNTGQVPSSADVVTSTVTQWQCYMAGDSGYMAIMMWRDETGAKSPLCFVIQRSLNASGTPVSSYVTFAGVGGTSSLGRNAMQFSIVFGAGVNTQAALAATGASLVCLKATQIASDNFNGGLSVSPVFPDVGYFDNPMDALAVGSISDFTEGSSYTIAAGNMPYGVSHTYIASSNGPLKYAQTNGDCCVLMRYD
jgi:hypothetical protein